MFYQGGQTQQRVVRNERGTWQVIHGDFHTGSQSSIDIPHWMVHSGRYFSVSDVDTDVDIIGPKNWLFRTPDNDELEFHVQFAISSSAQRRVELFEDVSVSADGTPISPINHKRTSIYVSQLEAFADPTVTDDGTRIDVAGIGSTGGAVKIGGVARSNSEWILKPDTLYVLRVTVAANDAVVSNNTEYYEFSEDEETWVDPASSSSS